jgi:hypothetical protein
MNKTWVLIVFGLCVGIALGGWGMRIYFERTLERWDPASRLLVQLDGDLGLAQDQKAKIAGILTGQKERMEEMRRQWKYQVTALGRHGEDAIASVLTPEQADRFTRIHDRIHVRMDRFLWTADTDPTAISMGPTGK